MNPDFEYFKNHILPALPGLFSVLSPFKFKAPDTPLYTYLESEISEYKEIIQPIGETKSVEAFNRMLYLIWQEYQTIETKNLPTYYLDILDFMASEEFITNPQLAIYKNIENLKDFNPINILPLLWWHLLEINLKAVDTLPETLNILYKFHDYYKEILGMLERQNYIKHNLKIAKIQSKVAAI